MALFKSKKETIMEEVKDAAMSLKEAYETKRNIQRDISLVSNYNPTILESEIRKRTLKLKNSLEIAKNTVDSSSGNKLLSQSDLYNLERLFDLSQVDASKSEIENKVKSEDVEKYHEDRTKLYDEYLVRIRKGEINLEPEARKIAVQYCLPQFKIKYAVEEGQKTGRGK